MERKEQLVEQLIRPTGLVDPEIEVRPVEGQIDDLMEEIRVRVERNERVLVTTLTKRMAEDLTEYLEEAGFRVRYLHSEIHTLDRVEILRDLRLGKFDVLVGINLLREGLDLPEVTLVAIWTRIKKDSSVPRPPSSRSPAGPPECGGKVIMYADEITDSMARAIKETNRRREKQLAYNKEHGITPATVKKAVRDLVRAGAVAEEKVRYEVERAREKGLTQEDIAATVARLEEEMLQAAAKLEFETAAKIRDELREWQKLLEE